MSDSLSSLYGGRGIALDYGKGSRVFDTNGREYIDFLNGHGAMLFGHADPVLTAALEEAARHVWSGGAGLDSPVRDELAEELSSIVGGNGRVFLTNSGTEAIEAAIKLAVSINPKRPRILACRRAFHGRTCGALSVTFNPKYKTPFGNFIAKAEHYNPEDLAAHIDENVAAVFMEPVQGEGGVFPIAPEIGRAVSEACAKNGAILIADEVQTGLGRCGAILASPLAGMSPDITCVAKGLAGGLPAGAAIWKKELGDFPSHSHGSTYGGNELVARVAIAALKHIRNDKLTEHAKSFGEFLRARLAKIDSPVIKEIRGLGLLNGIELEIPSLEVIRPLQENGVLALAAGPRVLRFLPSFAATERDGEEAAVKLEKTLKEISK
ncbi:MAG: aminotransferase class III-fold pyridoxal phosphate-dependent enzyme [Synergistaceae bacterium]|nr:aminotransferase class III-fold pyridoxal phosphate-dependent enzyme [Synergistaceae bacterium]